MNKTIIAIYGRENEGKSSTIKEVCKLLIDLFPNAISSIPFIDYSADILLTIQLGNIKIGLESQGDPQSRLIAEDSLRSLADNIHDPKLGECDIIICATRTRSETVKKVDQIAIDYDYNTLWISSFWSPTLDKKFLNRTAALNVIEIIKSLIIGQL